jgi:hypothetical protein
MGRPTKLTPQAQDMICRAVTLGVPVVSAALVAGISKGAVLQWLQRGEGRHARPATQVYVNFVDAIEKARAQDEARRVARLEQAARGGQVVYEKSTTYPDGRVTREVRLTEPQWTADAWFLERSRPEVWGRRDRLAVQVQIERVAEQIAGELGLSSAEVLAEAQRLLEEHDREA